MPSEHLADNAAFKITGETAASYGLIHYAENIAVMPEGVIDQLFAMCQG